MTQQQLAKRVGFSRSTLARIERGERVQLTSAWMWNLATVMRVSVRWLSGTVDDPTPPAYLTERETRLIQLFRSLDDNGQQAALETLADALVVMTSR